LVAKLLYGTGMRIMEALRLRTKDIDFEHNCIIIRCGKGDKDRVVMLPASLADSLKISCNMQMLYGRVTEPICYPVWSFLMH